MVASLNQPLPSFFFFFPSYFFNWPGFLVAGTNRCLMFTSIFDVLPDESSASAARGNTTRTPERQVDHKTPCQHATQHLRAIEAGFCFCDHQWPQLQQHGATLIFVSFRRSYTPPSVRLINALVEQLHKNVTQNCW